MLYGPKRTSHFSTIWLNKNDNKIRTSRSFSILFSVMGSLEIHSSLIYSPGSVVLCLEIAENIGQMLKSTFPFETSLMTSSI